MAPTGRPWSFVVNCHSLDPGHCEKSEDKNTAVGLDVCCVTVTWLSRITPECRKPSGERRWDFPDRCVKIVEALCDDGSQCRCVRMLHWLHTRRSLRERHEVVQEVIMALKHRHTHARHGLIYAEIFQTLPAGTEELHINTHTHTSTRIYADERA